MIDAVSAVLILLGLGFYLAGSIGLLRLPDLYSRLHALTKADNLGLGLLSAGLALLSQELFTAAKLLLICARAETACELEQALRSRGGIQAGLFHEGMSLLERDRAAAALDAHAVVTLGTAKRHVSNIYAKLGVHSRARAIAQARALRLL